VGESRLKADQSHLNSMRGRIGALEAVHPDYAPGMRTLLRIMRPAWQNEIGKNRKESGSGSGIARRNKYPGIIPAFPASESNTRNLRQTCKFGP
jgi:hypothetical protein